MLVENQTLRSTASDHALGLFERKSGLEELFPSTASVLKAVRSPHILTGLPETDRYEGTGSTMRKRVLLAFPYLGRDRLRKKAFCQKGLASILFFHLSYCKEVAFIPQKRNPVIPAYTFLMTGKRSSYNSITWHSCGCQEAGVLCLLSLSSNRPPIGQAGKSRDCHTVFW